MVVDDSNERTTFTSIVSLGLYFASAELKVDQIVSPFELVHKSGTKMERMSFPPVKQVRLAGWFEFWNLTTQSTTKGETDCRDC